MPLVKPYTTVALVKQETKESNSSLDTVYETAINSASRLVDDICGRDFWYHDHTSGNDPYSVPRRNVLGGLIKLPFPIIEITKLWVYSDVVAGATDNDLYESDEYHYVVGESVIHAEGERIFSTEHTNLKEAIFGSYPFTGFIELEGEFGYALVDDITPPADIPSEVQRATTLIAAAFSAENNKEVTTFDGGTENILSTSVPDEARTLLARYKEEHAYTF